MTDLPQAFEQLAAIQQVYGHADSRPVTEAHRAALAALCVALDAGAAVLVSIDGADHHSIAAVGPTTARHASRSVPPPPEGIATPTATQPTAASILRRSDEASWLHDLLDADVVTIVVGGRRAGQPSGYVALAGDHATAPEARRVAETLTSVVLTAAVVDRLDRQRLRSGELRTNALETMIDEVESARRRISHEIHDDVLQQVSSLAHFLEGLAEDADADDSAMLHRLWAEARGAARSLRRLVPELEPEQSSDETVEEALRALANRISRLFGLRVDVVVDDVPALERPVRRALERITQQALDNVVAHADATVARVTVRPGDDDTVTLAVTDDGVGFSLWPPWTAGVGVRSMHRRAEELGGHIEIESDSSGGAVVLARLPVRSVHVPSAIGPDDPAGLEDPAASAIRAAVVDLLEHNESVNIGSITNRAGIARRDLLERFASAEEVVSDAVRAIIEGVEHTWAQFTPIDTELSLTDRISELLERRLILERMARPIRTQNIVPNPTPRFDAEVLAAVAPELDQLDPSVAEPIGVVVSWLLRPRILRSILTHSESDLDEVRDTIVSMASIVMLPDSG